MPVPICVGGGLCIGVEVVIRIACAVSVAVCGHFATGFLVRIVDAVIVVVLVGIVACAVAVEVGGPAGIQRALVGLVVRAVTVVVGVGVVACAVAVGVGGLAGVQRECVIGV